jgi:hypothetical protein
VNADNAQTWTASNDVEARMLTAVQNADDVDYFAALRSAQFIMPVHTASGEPQLLTLDVDGQVHTAVFTSMEMTRRGIEQFTGDASGWHDARYKADEFVSAFADDDLRVLLNPGTPIQTSFTVHQLVGSWTALGDDIAVSHRRGSWRWALRCLIAALVLFTIGGNLLGNQVTCGSQVMDEDDTCEVTSNGSSTEQTFQQTQVSQNWLALVLLAGAGLSAVVMVYNVVARITTRGRRDRAP